ncbi:MAG: sulfotransferase domain-containing protein [Caldilineaceae bacterium]
MLDVGGLAVLTDNLREADVDNPKGYYEFERVKQLDKGDVAWLPEAQGKVVKIISMLLPYLPDDYHYKVLFMRREISEILASQRKMLANRGMPTDETTEAELERSFSKHLMQVQNWLQSQPNTETLYIYYNELLKAPAQTVPQINQFLDNKLDPVRMMEVIDPTLYRNRVESTESY